MAAARGPEADAGPRAIPDPPLSAAAVPSPENAPPDELGPFAGLRRALIVVFAVGWAVWQFWIAATVPWSPIPMRTAHLSFAFVLAFLMLPERRGLRGRPRLALDLTLGALSVLVFMYLRVNFTVPDFRRLVSPEPLDMALGGLCLGLVLLAVYRGVSRALAIVAGTFVLYAFFGAALPGAAGHGGFTAERVISFLYLRVEGVLGVTVGASATLIYPVVLFGALLIALGGGAFFSGLAMALLGHVRGGTAKISVLSSALFGTVTGTGPANVATTGVFTIPMMKRAGYPAPFAAAVESTASIGGQLLPPIMGASAFVMADFLGVSYATIVRHALIPSLLFYFVLVIAVDLEAGRRGLTRSARADNPPLWPVLAAGWHHALSLGVLIYTLGVRGLSVPRGAVLATMTLLGLEFARRIVARRPLELTRLVHGCVGAAKAGFIIATTTAAVQLVIGTVGLTGIGIKLSSLMVQFAGGRLWLLLILAMFASLLLGTGLPTVPTYLILAILTAPALLELGVPLVAAHFFVLYFGVIGDLTPPAALGPTVAAGIAGANVLRTMLIAMRLGLVGFLLPYMFVYSPGLMLQGTAVDIVSALVLAVAGLACLAVGLSGYLLAPTGRLVAAGFIAAAFLLIHPELLTAGAGFAVGGALTLHQWRRARKTRLAARPSVAQAPAAPE